MGLPICALRLGPSRAGRRIATLYVTVFRTIPDIALIVCMFHCLPPLHGLRVSGLASNSLALAFVSGAYLGEIFRAGMQSVAPGQRDAAHAPALPRRAIWARVVVPRAARLAIPPFVDPMTDLVRGATLLATNGVAVPALKAYVLGAQTFRCLEFLMAIAAVYFVVVFPVARLAERIGRRLAAATAR